MGPMVAQLHFLIIIASVFGSWYAEHRDSHHYHDHTHDPGVSSVSIVCEGSLDLEKVAIFTLSVHCTFDLNIDITIPSYCLLRRLYPIL